MTTSIKIVNDGHYPVVVKAVECERPRDLGTAVEQHDLQPGESSPSITVYGWRRYVIVGEMDPGT